MEFLRFFNIRGHHLFVRNQRHIFFLALFLLPYSLLFGQTRFDHSPLLDQSKVSFIKDTVDLSGRIVQLPENKKLVFDGGVLTNGVVVGHQNSIEAGEETCIFGNGCMVKGTWSTPARPEWFGAKADGIAYYNRPLCCYNGDVDSVKVSDQYVNVNISHPSSHIVNKNFWTCIPSHTTEDVYYDTSTHGFVLRVNNVYYRRWSNSNEWNDSKTGKASKGAVFSNLKTRETFIFNGKELVNIDSTMTDDSGAFEKAVLMGRGNVELKDKIYYLRTQNNNSVSATPWKSFSHFTFNGNGAKLFIRTKYVGDTVRFSHPSWAWLYQCSDGVFKNLNICALRDRDDGAVKGHHRLNSSDSRIIAFMVLGCKNLSFNNMYFQGMNHDFVIKRSGNSGLNHNIKIDNWTSRDVMQVAIAGVHGCYINHADVTQAPFIGTMHIIYGQSYLKGLFIKNSTFRQGDEYTAVMLTHHGGSNDPRTCPDSIFYDNCTIIGARMVQGNGGQHQTFRNCTFIEEYDHFATTKGKLETNRHIIIGTGIHLKFIDCKFNLKTSGLLLYDLASSKKLSLLLQNCVVNAPTVSQPLITSLSHIVVKNCRFFSKGPIFSKNSTKKIVCDNSFHNGKKLTTSL